MLTRDMPIVHVFLRRYFIDGPMIVNPGTYIHGAGADLVSIYFGEDTETTAPDAYVTSSSPGASVAWVTFIAERITVH